LGEVVEVDAEITVPDGEGPFPAVVLVHGGGWVAGAPRLMDPLSDFLNVNGYLTVNTRYTLATLDRPAFPDAVEDVACAVRYAASHPDGDGTVTVIGHSAGAHIGALVALTGDAHAGDCPYPGSGVPERFVGLAGPYDVSRIGFAIAAFFGGGPERVPELWEAGNPQHLAGENPELQTLILHGDLDGLVADVFALEFHEALLGAGVDSVLEVVEGARHNAMHDPALVGDLIVTWMSR
jgi:acetyl esterase/lipase